MSQSYITMSRGTVTYLLYTPFLAHSLAQEAPARGSVPLLVRSTQLLHHAVQGSSRGSSSFGGTAGLSLLYRIVMRELMSLDLFGWRPPHFSLQMVHIDHLIYCL